MRDVVYSCDANGARFLAVSLYSLLRHYRGVEPLRINVLEAYGGLPPEAKSQLESIVAKSNSSPSTRPSSLRFIDIESILDPYRDLIRQRDGSRWNIFAWIPVFGPDAVSDSTGNLLYLDIDTLVNADVSELFELDLSRSSSPVNRPCLLAAVYENHRGNFAAGQAEWDSGILPAEAECYFNDGVVVLDAVRFREEKCLESILKWYAENYARAHRIEQDALNALYWDRTFPLPAKWNYHDRTIRKYCLKRLSHYWDGNDPRDCFEAALHPAILHFWGKKKPWNPSHRPYRRLYHDAMYALGMEVPPEQHGAWVNNFVNWLAHAIIVWRHCGMLMSGRWFK